MLKNMTKPLLALGCALAMLVTACGGDAGPAPLADTAAPVLNSFTSAKSATGEFAITATGTDNVGLVGYFFKNTSAPPLAPDACFQA